MVSTSRSRSKSGSHLVTLTDRDIVKILGAKPLDFEPGTSAHYSNVGYVLLGMILEKVTGASIGAVLDSSIFDRAGMDDSVLAPTHWDVRGYADGKDVTADTGLNVFQAAGSVVSTAEDVDGFFHNLWAGKLLSPDLVEQMSRPLGDIPPYGGEYGLGIWTTTFSCGTALGHDGDVPGYAVKAWTLRDRHGLSSSWSTRAARSGTRSPTPSPRPRCARDATCGGPCGSGVRFLMQLASAVP